MRHAETHRLHRAGWLRAAVLGANDGIISTASLMVGMVSAHASMHTVIITGLAGLMSGAMAMAAGEYVSVSTQKDIEHADLARESDELANDQANELKELTHIYIARGLTPELAHEVAVQMTQHDALSAHARDELGIFEITSANPLQAALASACCFAAGATLPLVSAVLLPNAQKSLWLALISTLFLIMLGALAAKAGGASPSKGAIRIAFWGVVAMSATAMVGNLFGVTAG